MSFPGSLLLLVALQAQQPIEVIVEPSEFELSVNSTRQLTVIVQDSAGKTFDVRIRWISENSQIAFVDGSGLVTAIAPGETRIVAALRSDLSAFARVIVPQLPPSNLTMVLSTDVLVGASAPLTVAVETSLGEMLDWDAIVFESQNPEIATVDVTGRVFGHRPGAATIVGAAGDARAELEIRVRENPATSYDIEPTVAKARTGDVVRFRLSGRAGDGALVTGFQPGWVVSGPGADVEGQTGEGVFVAEEPGTYVVTAVIGEGVTRTATVHVEERNVPARLVQVGRGPASTHNSGDTWVFEGVDGRDYAYIGTFRHDWMKAWDVTDPSNPVLTDSIQVDARRINDVKIHPNNRLAIITREGASNRRNGIVLLDLSTPAHPTILSEYTETVTGGVHNVWIRGDEDLVYACHNGTNELHIIDISDPRNPEQVGRWGLQKESKTLHDVIVQDGYAYLSYWDDGVIMLDVGAGSHGGTATEPAFVSQFKYPIGNTHVAWRHGRYLFIGDEIFPSDWDASKRIEARGYVHVVDYEDPENPREVARYEVPEAGAHNLWAEGDRLYVGYYQAGLRVLDISGELGGDLYRQGREIAALKTTDANSVVPNWSMTWGAQLFKGNIYTADLNSGLWIARLIEETLVP